MENLGTITQLNIRDGAFQNLSGAAFLGFLCAWGSPGSLGSDPVPGVGMGLWVSASSPSPQDEAMPLAHEA